MVKEGGVYEQQKSQDQSNGHGGSRSNGSGTLPGNSICSDRGSGGWQQMERTVKQHMYPERRKMMRMRISGANIM